MRGGRPSYDPSSPSGRRRQGLIEGAVVGSSGNVSSGSFSRGRGGSHGHTLADEAKNTAQRRRGLLGPGGQDSKLRHKPVKFVSAGNINPLKELDEQCQKANKAELVKEVSGKARIDVDATNANVPAANPHNEEELSSNIFFIDKSGDKTLRPEKQAAVIIPVVPDDEPGHHSDSSEEVIVFKGRDTLRQATRSDSTAANRSENNNNFMQLQEIQTEIKMVEKTLETEKSLLPEDKLPLPESDSKTFTNGILVDIDPNQDRRPTDETESDEEAALIADYIANMDKDEEDDEDEADIHPGIGSSAFVFRDLGGDKDDSDGERGRQELDDEELARTLAKQEKLGLGDDYADSEDELEMGLEVKVQRKKKGSSKMAKIFQKKGQYPSASLMADAFDEFDLLDLQGSVAPQVSDPELQEAMQMSFQKDRLKKVEKKKQREAHRAQGLLGKKINPEDLQFKYPVGMRNDELADELEQFLMGTDEQLVLPPFDKACRRIIHVVADKLNLKSQSAGSGMSRHAVLYRTGKTMTYDEQSFTRATNRLIGMQFFARVDVDQELVRERKAVLSSKPNNIKAKRGRNAISYREGEIVGQNATELGQENKGRLLLEKMGWTKGMALGTHENKGIMVPIGHVVKKTKAGLGEA